MNCAVPIQHPLTNGHHRWRSLDAVPENTTGANWLQKIPGMTAEPNVAAEVARVFGNKVCVPTISREELLAHGHC
jgi:hypothetical protein